MRSAACKQLFKSLRRAANNSRKPIRTLSRDTTDEYVVLPVRDKLRLACKILFHVKNYVTSDLGVPNWHVVVGRESR